jgi:hypothetical protein
MSLKLVLERHDIGLVALVVGATALAWAGFFAHNVADLPGQSILSPESLYPTAVTVVLLVVWWAPTTRTLGTWLLIGWTTLNLVGGLLSVLPLPMLPFAPSQTRMHYAFHGVYAVTQVPLLWICYSLARARTPRGGWPRHTHPRDARGRGFH